MTLLSNSLRSLAELTDETKQRDETQAQSRGGGPGRGRTCVRVKTSRRSPWRSWSLEAPRSSGPRTAPQETRRSSLLPTTTTTAAAERGRFLPWRHCRQASPRCAGARRAPRRLRPRQRRPCRAPPARTRG